VGKSKKKANDGRGQHPNSRAALLEHKAPPFPPGVSGNPSGRSKPIQSDLQAQLNGRIPGDRRGRTYLRLMNEGAILRARKDAAMYREPREMVDGPVEKVANGTERGIVTFGMTLSEVDERLTELLRIIADR
jgi:hypothetical protein